MAIKNGTSGNNTITPFTLPFTGNNSADIVYGLDGNDTLDYATSFADNDLFGGNGSDVVTGGSGNDLLDGGANNDKLTGNNGSDTLLGGTGDDLLNGGAGNDNLSGGTGSDTLKGGDDNDLLLGEAGTDTLEGNDGSDTLLGGADNDTLKGGSGKDNLKGDAGNDNLDGGSGNDNLDGGANNDTLKGGSGNDQLIGGAGSDTLIGEDGDDTFVVNITTSGTLEDSVSADGGIDTIQVVGAYVGGTYKNMTAASAVENYDISGTGSSKLNLTGNSSVNTLTGNDANNSLYGLNGNDVINGGNGNDVLVGGAGNDTLTGGANNDTFRFDSTPSATTNKDTITDFVSGVDNLHLSKSVMNQLGSYGQFSAGDARFWSSSTGLAHDSSDRIIYNTATGELFYDSNGSSGGGAVVLETVGLAGVAATDIWVV